MLNLFHALWFYLGVTFTSLKKLWGRPRTKQHKKVRTTQIAYKEGESYRLGECIVTLAKFGVEGKQEVAAKIAYWDLMRKQKEEELTKRGQEIMLMSPEELKQLQVEEWIQQRKAFNEKKYYENLRDNYQQTERKA